MICSLMDQMDDRINQPSLFKLLITDKQVYNVIKGT